MKECKIPKEMSKEFAEELGIHVGDGHMSFRPYSYCVTYEYSISGNSNEADYLVDYVKPLIQKLYMVLVWGSIKEKIGTS